ncbi:hypothetical protein EVAR_90258_1 [Eumeta japonica]|uniref:Uncharacterized protein n=1 Tax=Eumeta variegata TaxID=151549 RepID=A0A4C2AFC7_EUMVA|nr:hypothetical protein EVAR_90258_1 [Eumeta japonica]
MVKGKQTPQAIGKPELTQLMLCVYGGIERASFIMSIYSKTINSGSLLPTANKTQAISREKMAESINRRHVDFHHNNTRPHTSLAISKYRENLEVSLDVDVNTEKTIDISENIGDDQTENIIKNFNADRTNTLSTYHGGDNNLNTLQEKESSTLVKFINLIVKVIITQTKVIIFLNLFDLIIKNKLPILKVPDTASSIQLDSPENMPTMASKMISKLSNGNSSTPSDVIEQKPVTIIISDNESDGTPDMVKGVNKKGKRNDSFRLSNNTTPSTISPLPNGHTMPLSTPQVPTFDIHWSNNEDGEFLSMYIVRTDNDTGMDMCKEFQRISKRFTIDPYLADVSSSTSPSSVTSVGLINLPNRTSFASTSSSTTTSNRTCDGAFVAPQPQENLSQILVRSL